MGTEDREAKLAIAEALEAAAHKLTYQGKIKSFEPYEKQKVHLSLGRTNARAAADGRQLRPGRRSRDRRVRGGMPPDRPLS